MRVLARQMAREMTVQEIDQVSGGNPPGVEIQTQSTGTCLRSDVAGGDCPASSDQDNVSD